MNDNILDNDSILTSIKKLIGITEEYTIFDKDIMIHINSLFLDLQQLGVGEGKYFAINDSTAIWTDYIPSGYVLNAVKAYIYLNVKLVFDTPTSSVVVESIKNTIDKYGWRINVACEDEGSVG